MRSGLFLILISLLYFNNAYCQESLSITENKGEFNKLVSEFINATEIMHNYSQNIPEYFEKGLGWHNENSGQYGFHTGNHEVFFSSKRFPFIKFDAILLDYSMSFPR